MAIDLIDQDAPIAYVRLQVVGKARQWKVLRCPFCGEVHRHGAGDQDDDPRAFLGGRLSHCWDESVLAGEYRLVEWSGQDLPSKAEIRAANRKRTRRQPIERDVRAAVWARTNGHCWYCGSKTNPFDDFAIDHVIPVSAGGSNEHSNLVPSCRTCNSRKQARPVEELRRFMSGGAFWFEYGLDGEKFRVGERVKHKVFGIGIVAAQDAAEGQAASIVRFEHGHVSRRIVNTHLIPDGEA